MRERIMAARLELVEDASAARHDRPQFPSDAPPHHRSQGSPLHELLMGQQGLLCNALTQRRMRMRSVCGLGNVGLLNAVPCHGVLRQIEPPAPPIAYHVLQEIDPLQSGADRIRQPLRLMIEAPGQTQYQMPDRVSRPAAVIEQRRGVREAMWMDILHKR